MKTTHTPGPWKAKRLSNHHDQGCVLLWPDKGGAHMRRLDYQGNFTGPDAKLIAAAPDLLDVAQYIVDRAEYQKWDEKDALLVCARDAIAKATRGQS